MLSQDPGRSRHKAQSISGHDQTYEAVTIVAPALHQQNPQLLKCCCHDTENRGGATTQTQYGGCCHNTATEVVAATTQKQEGHCVPPPGFRSRTLALPWP
eukprot:1161694-Pelagomonas_calceolata.AAC.8